MGTEFGTENGMVMVTTRALYGLKSYGASWRANLADILKSPGYKSSGADANVWTMQ